MMSHKELQIFKRSFPIEKKGSTELAVPEETFNEVISQSAAIKWFKLYDKSGKILGTVYLFLKSYSDNVVCVLNKLHPHENDNPRVSIKYAFQKFLDGEYFILDKLDQGWDAQKEFFKIRFNFTLNTIFRNDYNKNRAEKDFIGCINYLNQHR